MNCYTSNELRQEMLEILESVQAQEASISLISWSHVKE